LCNNSKLHLGVLESQGIEDTIKLDVVVSREEHDAHLPKNETKANEKGSTHATNQALIICQKALVIQVVDHGNLLAHTAAHKL
jgi:hypothetical protein